MEVYVLFGVIGLLIGCLFCFWSFTIAIDDALAGLVEIRTKVRLLDLLLVFQIVVHF